jgi:1-acyl-sn-glycerol-3-phosphate acyltransferase
MIVWNLVVNFIEYFVFIIPLLGIIFCVFYRVECEGEASSVARCAFMYLYLLLSDDGRMDD